MQFNIPAEYRNASGVYIIRNTIDERVYVGSASCFRVRYHHHTSTIRRNKHNSSKVQHFVNKYGTDCLFFELLEIVEGTREELLLAEQKWIIFYKASEGNNLNIKFSTGAGSGPIMRYKRVCPWCNTSFETNILAKKYCNNTCSGASRGANMKGKKRSPEIAAKIVATRNSRSSFQPTAEQKQRRIERYGRNKICPVCSNQFITPLKHCKQIHCSFKCGRVATAETQRGRLVSEEQRNQISDSLKAYFSKPESRTKPVGRPPGNIARNNEKEQKTTERKCPTCDTIFRVKENEKKRFCARACIRWSDKAKELASVNQKGRKMSESARLAMKEAASKRPPEYYKNLAETRRSPRKVLSTNKQLSCF